MILTPEQLAAEMALAVATVDVKVAAVRKVSSEVVATDARSRVPVLTGTLRDSIVVDEDGIGPTAPYGAFVEYGTSDTPPQPYMGPAADVAEPGFAAGVLLAGVF